MPAGRSAANRKSLMARSVDPSNKLKLVVGHVLPNGADLAIARQASDRMRDECNKFRFVSLMAEPNND